MSTLQILHHRTLIKDSVPEFHDGMGKSRSLLPQRYIAVVMHSEPTIESEAGKKYTIEGDLTIFRNMSPTMLSLFSEV